MASVGIRFAQRQLKKKVVRKAISAVVKLSDAGNSCDPKHGRNFKQPYTGTEMIPCAACVADSRQPSDEWKEEQGMAAVAPLLDQTLNDAKATIRKGLEQEIGRASCRERV